MKFFVMEDSTVIPEDSVGSFDERYGVSAYIEIDMSHPQLKQITVARRDSIISNGLFLKNRIPPWLTVLD